MLNEQLVLVQLSTLFNNHRLQCFKIKIVEIWKDAGRHGFKYATRLCGIHRPSPHEC